MALLIDVEDIVLASNDSSACCKFKAYVNECFNIKDLRPLKYFLVIKATHGPKGWFLSP